MFEIKYEHEQNGKLFTGLITGGTEAPKASWSSGGAPTDAPMDEESFDLLWNGISEVEVIKKAIVKAKKEAAAADLAANHRITATMKEGKSTSWTFVVPVSAEGDAAFARWLAALNVPAGKL